MVLTLKVTSAGFNYQDGLIRDEDSLREAQKKYCLDKRPSFLAYLGYCFNCGTHLVGPVFELRDYMDWTEDKGVSAKVEASITDHLRVLAYERRLYMRMNIIPS